MPQGAFEIFRDQVSRVTANGRASLGFTFLFGLAVALWSANAGMKAIIDALNVIYEEKEKRGFRKLNATSLAMTASAVVSLLCAIAAVVVLPLFLNLFGLSDATDLLIRLLRWPVLLVLVLIGLAALYRFGPSRKEPRWESLTVGASLGQSPGSQLRRYYRGTWAMLPTMAQRTDRWVQL